jgi:hypothetical protein
LDKARHAFAVLAMLQEGKPFNATDFRQELDSAVETCRSIGVQICETRAKDFRNPFKKATFRNHAEIEQVAGTAKDDPFVRLSAEECLRMEELLARIAARLPEE